jgi:hypothetical protein
MDVKEAIRIQLLKIYETKGLTNTLNAGYELMAHCEKNATAEKYRLLKGEIAEVILECELIELQKKGLTPSIVLKGLCIPFRDSNSTTEMDVTLITKKRVYLFECKSYSHKPKVTDICKLGSTMDIYSQSMLHLKALNQYIGNKYNKVEEQKPYKFIFFEMSTLGVEDLRTEENKKRIPVVNPMTMIETLVNDYNDLQEMWDINGAYKILKPLSANSDEVFQQHMARILRKKGKVEK